jgi:hypothetical protein
LSVEPVVAAEVRLEIEKGIPACIVALQPLVTDIGLAVKDAGVVVVERGVAGIVLEEMEDIGREGVGEWRGADKRSVDTTSQGGL